MATASKRTRARRGEGERLRGEILDAVDELLARDLEAVSVRAIAEVVGRTPPAIYLHFGDKRELLTAVCERRFQRFHRFVDNLAEDDPLAALAQVGRGYIRFGLENPHHFGLLKVSATENDATARKVLGVFRRMVDACIDGGALPEELRGQGAIVFWSACHGATELSIASPGAVDDQDALIETLLDVQVEGLLAI